MIIVIGGIKGGAGKTTIATNLTVIYALQGLRVLLVDADEQRSSSDWAEHRESLGIETLWTTIQLLGTGVRAQLLKMSDDYDIIIVDSGGRDTTSQRSALTVADVFLAPFQPRSLDVWTAGKVVTLINEIRTVNPKLIAYAIINRADSKGTDNDDAADILKESKEITFLSTSIGQRKAFANAASEGLGVIELKVQDKKARLEILSVASKIADMSQRHHNDTTETPK